MTPEDHIRAAQRLDHAEKARHQIGCISQDHPSMTLADAYAIQREWVALKKAGGGAVRGRKIGLTSRAMQSQLKIDMPDSGVLFDDMFFDCRAEVAPDRFIEPRIEAEIAFGMARDLKGPDVGPAEVLAATDWVAPALEILDTRIFRKDPLTGQARLIFDTIADNAANAGLVVGAERQDARRLDLRRIGAIVTRNGLVEETGLGAGVMGDPLQAMAWLANRLAEYDDYIRAGDVVLSGSFIRAIEAPSGSDFHADFGPFGSVSITFS